MTSVTVIVYLVDGRKFAYEVESIDKAKEHAHRITNEGWRNTERGVMCYYPVHQVQKVKFDLGYSGEDKDTLYFAQPL